MPKIIAKIDGCESQAEEEALRNGGDPLRTLCRKEVESFSAWLHGWAASLPEGAPGSEYQEGLAKWERRVVEGYLYQKIKGHFK